MQHHQNVQKVNTGGGTQVNDCFWFCSKSLIQCVIHKSAPIVVVLNGGSWMFLYESLHKAHTCTPALVQSGLSCWTWLWMGGVQDPFHQGGFFMDWSHMSGQVISLQMLSFYIHVYLCYLPVLHVISST